MNPRTYIVLLIGTLAACFGIQSAALHASGGRTVKSESNFFSSVGRIQAGAQGKVDVLLLGSSITGRLPDRAQGFKGVANMGCDGGSAVDVLRAIDRGILPSAPVMIIEANTLNLALSPKVTEVSATMDHPWFKVGLKVPSLSAYARPSAFVYSKLLAGKIGSFDLKPGEDLGVTTKPSLLLADASIALSGREQELVNELSGMLGRLRASGVRLVLVWLPPGRPGNASAPAWVLELARRNEIPWWDLGQLAAPGTVVLTDGVHMAAPSAARTMVSLQAGLNE